MNKQTTLDLESSVAYQAIIAPTQDTNLIFVSNILLGSSLKYSAVQMNILFIMISNIQKFAKSNYFKISTRDFCKKTGNHNIKSEIAKEIQSLLSKPIHVPLPNKKDWLKVNFISSAEYNDKEGYVEFGVDNKIKPLITNLLKEFTAINIAELFKVRSKHSKKIGMHLSRFKSTGVWMVKVDDLKNRLGIQTQYNKIHDLKQSVVEQAQKDFKDTSLAFDVKYHKKPGSNKTQTIEFRLLSHTPLERAINDNAGDVAFKKLIELGIREVEAKQILLFVPLQEINRSIWGIKKNIAKKKFEQTPVDSGAYSWATFRNKFNIE